jgi:putative pyoverdin transport system ATP-binding/permease protein
MPKRKVRPHLVFLLICIGITGYSFGQQRITDSISRLIDRNVEALMKEGNIPGMSLVVITDGKPMIRSYGFSDLKSKKPVESNTQFELGSCTKAFTALAVAGLLHDNKLKLTDYVSDYIPWLNVRYKDIPVRITVAQLLYHTSGIPRGTISKIPQTNDSDALEKTIRQIQGQELDRLPGTKYEYATINYDVLALIIQTVTGQSFETYVQDSLIGKLHLVNTTMGHCPDSSLKATGYKIGFFEPREYKAPIFRGNDAAGYINTNAEDASKWLLFQMGCYDTAFYELAKLTHQRDETVPLHDMSSYAMGWQISLSGNGEISHEGLNPNYSAYFVFRIKNRSGVAVLTNSNSSYTTVIGDRIIKLLNGEKIEKEYDPGDNNDKVFSIATIILGGYVLTVIAFIFLMIAGIVKKERKYVGFPLSSFFKIALLCVLILPFLAGLYLLPRVLFDFTWSAMFVWTPVSFTSTLLVLLTAALISFIAYIISLGFPESNRYKRAAPKLILLSILSGLANMLLIILITSSLNTDMKLGYLIFYYVLTLCVYLLGRRFVQVNLTKLTMEVIYELKMHIADKIFSTSFQKFEKIDRGLVYTVMNDDIEVIGDSTNMFIVFITSVITAVGALLYLGSIAFWATVLAFALILILTTMYFFVSRNTNKHYETARDTRNEFMRLLNGMIDGFKEISLHRKKKKEYKEDVRNCAEEYRSKMTEANIRFVNASFTGEAVLIITLGLVAFAFPKVFPGIKSYTLMSFLIVLLYLIGPVNIILNSVPTMMRFRIAVSRIRNFIRVIPSNNDNGELTSKRAFSTIESIKAEGVTYQYEDGEDSGGFSVGPIDLEIDRGQIVFIIGGNGSGKTTLAKLFTGLYEPDQGVFRINGQITASRHLGENFSTVFSPIHIFKKLYSVDVKEKSGEISRYLRLLNLEQKVEMNGNAYSTVDLSGGQRKRLALLQCYLEDSPIYLFDEWAADQDPAYRLFFYRTLLPQMKMSGKIIIAITHDDHYFDVADKVYKMDEGKLAIYSERQMQEMV